MEKVEWVGKEERETCKNAGDGVGMGFGVGMHEKRREGCKKSRRGDDRKI